MRKTGAPGAPAGRHRKQGRGPWQASRLGKLSLRSRKRGAAVAVAAAVATGGAAYGVVAGAAGIQDPGSSGAAMSTAQTVKHLPALDASAARPRAHSVRPTSSARPAAKKPVKAPPSRPAARPAAPSRPAAQTLSCTRAGGLLPANVSAIVSFLVHHGYSDNAAAGIAGNIYQESKGNPESAGMGGGGLIGFTPLPAGYETGDVAADLRTQLSAILTFNQQWSSYLPELNAAASPAAAAAIYVTDFERAGLPEAATREASAQDVAAACGL